jgi:hypothetical protein
VLSSGLGVGSDTRAGKVCTIRDPIITQGSQLTKNAKCDSPRGMVGIQRIKRPEF